MDNSRNIDQLEYGDENSEENLEHFIGFMLQNEWYGIEITRTKEILEMREISVLPFAALHIAGITNLRGSILSVTDLKRVFNLKSSPRTAHTRILVIEHEGKETGLLVDQICGAVAVPGEKIVKPMLTLSGPAADYIAGEAQLDGKLLGILNAAKLIF